jgi:hypothetical protein
MINNILLITEIIFLISLIFASIAAVKTWLLSKKLTKDIKDLLSKTYPLNLTADKYKNLNEFLILIINKAENQKNFENDLQELEKEYNIPQIKVKDIESLIKKYAENIHFWNKYGKISGYIAVISGAVSFIMFYLLK